MIARIALPAALLLVGTAALAQSNVTLSGRIDLNVGKDIGAGQKRMGTGSMSHLTFAGTEDLGGGLLASFKLATRINADNGSINAPGAFLNSPPGTYWSQESSVGLRGSWGSLTLGRQMTAALLPQILVDPWFWDNTTSGFTASTGLIGNLWYNDAATYAHNAGAFSFTAQVAAKDANPGWSGTPNKTPYSFALGYAPGPWQVRFGYEKPADGRSKLATLFGGYNFGAFTLNAMVAGGTDHTDASVRTWAVSSVIPAGSGQFRASFGHYKRADVVGSQKLALGYHHFLSKRTSVYTTLAHDSKAADHKSGYEVGLQHTF
ncbi:porin [Hydrogenophaga sp.]|uniref:porin n=1 Tax=Hydrogenophaga sp. TaxID=1904254 RepID=UPI002FC7C51E